MPDEIPVGDPLPAGHDTAMSVASCGDGLVNSAGSSEQTIKPGLLANRLYSL